MQISGYKRDEPWELDQADKRAESCTSGAEAGFPAAAIALPQGPTQAV
jgi:hypothetical protein